MKWLQYSTTDLENGLGGVETHARCLARELGALGIEATLSNDKTRLSENWDVIHTHGSGFPIFDHLKKRIKRPVWVHTLHGWSLERMLACKEYFWLGGYHASARELAAVAKADVVLSVHEMLTGFKLLSAVKKNVLVCSNGWDSFYEKFPVAILPAEIPIDGDFWVYIGRGEDVVKGADVVKKILIKDLTLKIVALPGTGFEDQSQLIRVPRQTPEAVHEILRKSRGLVLTSLYEGLPLVALEALSQGTIVVANRVGGMKTLDPELEGLVFSNSNQDSDFSLALAKAKNFSWTDQSRNARAQNNRKLLKTWRDVAEISLQAVQQAISRKMMT